MNFATKLRKIVLNKKYFIKKLAFCVHSATKCAHSAKELFENSVTLHREN